MMNTILYRTVFLRKSIFGTAEILYFQDFCRSLMFLQRYFVQSIERTGIVG